MIKNSILLMMGASEDAITAPTDYVGFWELDLDSLDSSGNANHGTDANITYDGEYAHRDGTTTTSFISANVALTTAYTYSTWIKAGADNDYMQVYDNYLNELTTGRHSMYFYIVGSTNDMVVRHNDVFEQLTVSIPIVANHIYHITQTWSTTQGYPIVEIYDKTSDVSDTLHFTTLTSTAYDGFSVIVGMDATSSQYTILDHSNIRIYDYIITTEQNLLIRAEELAEHT